MARHDEENAITKSDLEAAETLDLAEELADRCDLEGEERAQFVRETMVRAGYKIEPRYVIDVKEDQKTKGNGKHNGNGKRNDKDEWDW